MDRPKEFRRVVFGKQDVAEALIGPAGADAKVQISRSPRIFITVDVPGESRKCFAESDVIDKLCDACRTFEIPVPRFAEKRLLIDRNREGAVILQMSSGILV